MPDFFVSYAREDEPFVERLNRALSERDREVWLDRSQELGDGIEPGDNWRASVQEGIDRSDAVVFVLSHASLSSEPCRAELAHAATVNKRLLPVCIDEPAAGVPIPAEIRDLSWVMMRPGDDFGAGVSALIRGLETDIEIVREHTRLLVRAKAWELGERRSSPLLRGDELRRAEDWLSRAATAGAPPTTTQREFIVASRAAATRRARIAVAGALAVAAVAIGLSVFALVQRSDAVHEKNVAVSQRNIAYARQLDADAQADASTDPELSVLLADRSAHVWPAQGKSSLQTALSESEILKRYPLAKQGRSGDALWNSQGTRVLITSPGTGSGTWARIYEPGTSSEPVSLPGPTEAGAVAWDARGDRVAIGGIHPAVYDSRTGRLIGRIPQATGYVALSSDGNRAFYADDHAVGHIYDLRTRRTIISFRPRHPSGVYCLVLSPDGSSVLQCNIRRGSTQANPHTDIDVWNTATGKLERSVTSSSVVTSPAFSPGGGMFAFGTLPPHLGTEHSEPASATTPGTFVYTTAGRGRPVITFPLPSTAVAWGGIADSPFLAWASVSNSIGHVYVFNRQQQYQLAGATDQINQLAFDSDFHVLAASEDGDTRVYGLAGGQPIETLVGDTASVTSASFGAGGEYIATSSKDGTARIWQGPFPPLVKARPLGPDEPPTYDTGLSWLGNTRALIFGAPNPSGESPWDSIEEIIDARTLQADASFHPPRGDTFDVSVAGNVIATASQRGGQSTKPSDVRTYSGSSGAALAKISPRAGGQLSAPVLGGSGAVVAVADGDGIDFDDAHDGRPISRVTYHRSLDADAFSPDDAEFAGLQTGARGAAVKLMVWNVRTGRLIRTIAGPPLTVEVQDTDDLSPLAITFSPDGRLIALSGAAPEVDVYRVDTGTRVHRWSLADRSDGRFAGRLAFSPDGEMLAAATGNGAYVWRLPTGRLILTLRQISGSPPEITDQGDVLSVGFSSDSRYLTTVTPAAYGGGSISEWDVETGAKVLSLGELSNAASSPDGRNVLTTGLGGLRMYSCDLCGDLNQLEAVARTRVTRGFTRAERARYLRP